MAQQSHFCSEFIPEKKKKKLKANTQKSLENLLKDTIHSGQNCKCAKSQGCMDGWTDGQVDGRTDGRTDGQNVIHQAMG